MSAAFGTLLVFDVHRQDLVAAYGLEGRERSTGLALRGSELCIVNSEGDALVVEKPVPGQPTEEHLDKDDADVSRPGPAGGG